jgi:hypothetical protein
MRQARRIFNGGFVMFSPHCGLAVFALSCGLILGVAPLASADSPGLVPSFKCASASGDRMPAGTWRVTGRDCRAVAPIPLADLDGGRTADHLVLDSSMGRQRWLCATWTGPVTAPGKPRPASSEESGEGCRIVGQV